MYDDSELSIYRASHPLNFERIASIALALSGHVLKD